MSDTAIETEVVEGEVVSEDEVAEESEIQEIELQDFEARVTNLVGMMNANPEVMHRCLAEMYVFMTDMEQAMRTMQLNGGPMKMLKALMGKG